MKSRPGLNKAIGVALAVIAGLLLLGYVSRLVRGDGGGTPVTVNTAARDIEAGTLVTGDLIREKRIPLDYVVSGSVKSGEEIVGARALRFIGKGEPFTSSALSGAGSGSDLASRIPEASRAYTLHLGTYSGYGEDVRVGDHVDVLATTGDPPRTSTILRARLVLGSSDTAPGGEEQSPQREASITLLVSPQEAELLAQAEYVGEISISLCPLQE